jgi:hypothetical protein
MASRIVEGVFIHSSVVYVRPSMVMSLGDDAATKISETSTKESNRQADVTVESGPVALTTKLPGLVS